MREYPPACVKPRGTGTPRHPDAPNQYWKMSTATPQRLDSSFVIAHCQGIVIDPVLVGLEHVAENLLDVGRQVFLVQVRPGLAHILQRSPIEHIAQPREMDIALTDAEVRHASFHACHTQTPRPW